VPFSSPGLAAHMKRPDWWTPERPQAPRDCNLAMARREVAKERWRAPSTSATTLACALSWNRLARQKEQPWETDKAFFQFLIDLDAMALQCWEETPVGRQDMSGLFCDVLGMRDHRQLRKLQRGRLTIPGGPSQMAKPGISVCRAGKI